MISHHSDNIANLNFNTIIGKVEKLIDFTVQVQHQKAKYSAKKSLNKISQLCGQIETQPEQNRDIQKVKDLKSLKSDAHMSVMNVQRKKSIKRGRSKTKMFGNLQSRLNFSLNTFANENSSNMQTRKKFEELSQHGNSESSSYSTQQKMREDKNQEGNEKDTTKNVRKTYLNRLKFHKIGGLNSKFVQDYTGQRLKYKSLPKQRLVTQQKSLNFQVLKKIQKFKVEKKNKKKIEAIVLETRKVTERKKKKREEKRKRKRTMLKEQIQAQPLPVHVQFSSIKSLTDNFSCQKGVVFSQGSELVRNTPIKSYQTLNTSLSPSSRISKQQYSILKKRERQRQKTLPTISNYDSSSTMIQSERLPSHSQQQQYSSSNLQKQKKNSERIHINKSYLYEDLLKPIKISQNLQTLTPKAQNLCKSSFDIPLSHNDRFNQKYIVNKNYHKESKLDTKVSGGILLPKVHYDYHIKNREKTQRKTMLINLIRQKFQQSLRKQQLKN